MRVYIAALQKEVKELIYGQFIEDSENQLKSVNKQRHPVDLNSSACEFGGCWNELGEGISYNDVEDLISEYKGSGE